MAATADPRHLSDALLGFALDGRFPEDVASIPPVSETDLQPALDALSKSHADLVAEIHTINSETRDEVSSWVKNAKLLQEDIIRSKTIANELVRDSEAPDVSGRDVAAAEENAEFLNREVQYSAQLFEVLRGIQYVNQLHNEVEQASKEHRILDSLHLLEKSWAALDSIGASKTCRVMKILDLRAFELKSSVHEVFDQVWKSLVQVDMDVSRIAIHDRLQDQQMSLNDAVVGLKAYKEVDERMEQLWRNLDAAIISPRMNSVAALRAIEFGDDFLQLDGQAEASKEAVLTDLEQILGFIARKLPSELLGSLCSFMMADMVPRLINNWLNPAVPSSLTDMDKFQDMIQRTKQFCAALETSGYTGYQELDEWVTKAPKVWSGKCKETALDTIRTKLTKGIGESKKVEKVEKQMVSLAEGKELATSGAAATTDANEWGQDWGDAWDEGGDDYAAEDKPEAKKQEAAVNDDDGADAWGWDEETHDTPDAANKSSVDNDEDEGADAWGWGDEDATAAESKSKHAATRQAPETASQGQTRELVLKETYNISSMPEPVLDLIYAILEDGAILTRDGGQYSHVATQAPELFGLPTFALALFRAVSPYYYSLDVGGNMFLYNDAMYLAEKLSEFSTAWKQREDLTARAKLMLRLDNDVKSLRSFANRSYANEMNVQKTILRDLIGGEQSLMQQDEPELAIESGTTRIRSMAAVWSPILAKSVWSQAIGSLADALATKIITDVLEMSSIGQDEAYNIAKLMASATELDDLFLPSKASSSGARAAEDEVPTTAQYAPNWLRLKYLSEFLQSNLNEVKFLWCDSELSLYFTLDEVVDLIRASFEDNARTRETIREIQSKPRPTG
ncbi:hypothetical protein S40285_02254 [Stachybotrys chlorohalonatus IBT 40285]|uniref:Retrograde transport protein Dsl1 C-terminal domain-containing protein n=1 Tax=Stachybotrys chlorohalonatus (strain IBT 40285) TaxID=1283841 RepID=A0A084QG06_STAC4|nr:hypothetical protein S40285_02254 [Stachybotrys chlorohalonata IBT 40285]